MHVVMSFCWCSPRMSVRYSEPWLRPSPLRHVRCTMWHRLDSPSLLQTSTYTGICIHVNERCRRKEERSKQGHTSNKAKQHNTLKAVTFSKEKRKMSCLGWDSNPRHSTLYKERSTSWLDISAGSSAGWGQILHLIVHCMNRVTIKSV